MKKYLVEVSGFDKESLDFISNAKSIIFNSEEEARAEYNQICLDDYRPNANERLEKFLYIIELDESEIEGLNFPLDITVIKSAKTPKIEIGECLENEHN